MKNLIIILLVFPFLGCSKMEDKEIYGKKINWYQGILTRLEEGRRGEKEIAKESRLVKANGFSEFKNFQNGYAIVKSKEGRLEEGVFLLRDDGSGLPSGSGYVFQKIGEHVFWYEYKEREQRIQRWGQ